MKILEHNLHTGERVEEFVDKLEKYYSKYNDKKGYSGVQDLNKYIVIEFFKQEIKPTLTEDENSTNENKT